MASIIQIRRDTASNWTSANPILALGEMGAETDTSKIKIGDGVTAWTSVPYLIDAGGYLTATSTNTLTNKTITFAGNTLTGVAPTTTPTLTVTFPFHPGSPSRAFHFSFVVGFQHRMYQFYSLLAFPQMLSQFLT